MKISPIQADLQGAHAGLFPVLDGVASGELVRILDGLMTDGFQTRTVGGIQDVVQLRFRGEDRIAGVPSRQKRRDDYSRNSDILRQKLTLIKGRTIFLRNANILRQKITLKEDWMICQNKEAVRQKCRIFCGKREIALLIILPAK